MIYCALVWAALLAATVTALPTHEQLPFLSPEVTPGDFPTTGVTVLSHPALPHHSVRLREPQGLCDPAVQSWAGYPMWPKDATAKPSRHMFSWLFESRSDPKNDPVVVYAL